MPWGQAAFLRDKPSTKRLRRPTFSSSTSGGGSFAPRPTWLCFRGSKWGRVASFSSLEPLAGGTTGRSWDLLLGKYAKAGLLPVTTGRVISSTSLRSAMGNCVWWLLTGFPEEEVRQGFNDLVGAHCVSLCPTLSPVVPFLLPCPTLWCPRGWAVVPARVGCGAREGGLWCPRGWAVVPARVGCGGTAQHRVGQCRGGADVGRRPARLR